MPRRLVLGLAALAALLPATPAAAQSAASAFTSATRYDLDRKVLGTIAPDPDGTGPLRHAATRNSYDPAGRLVRVESGELQVWKSEAVPPSAWGSDFIVSKRIDTSYDLLDRKVKEVVSEVGPGPGFTVTARSVTQFSYDVVGRLECTAVRMNPATWGSLPASACTPGTAGSDGGDRITRNVYDDVGQVLKVQKAYGTALQQDYVTYSYTPNGKQASVTDANGNRAAYGYDGHDRQILWAFPSTTVPGAPSTTDFEQYGYDANNNRTSLRKRDGRTLTYTYDGLDRVRVKTVSGACVSGYACTSPPAWAVRNVYSSYDARGQLTSARFDSASGTDAVINAYDGFGRLTSSTVSMGGVSRTVGRQYDADGNRIRVTHPDGTYFTYDYDGLDRMSAIRQNGTTQVASYDYDAKGQRWHTARGAVLTTYGYDGISRLASLNDDLSGTAADVTSTFGYNPASQITSFGRSNTGYAYAAYTPASNAYTVNALNQYMAVGPGALGYDSNGNLASNGGTSFTYDVENRLVSAVGTLNSILVYDPTGRLFSTGGTSPSGSVQFLYDGDERIGEYDGSSGALLRRYVHGPGDDDPQLWYEGSGLSDRRSLQANHQGSIVSSADASGAMLAIKAYDEYGVPSGGDVGAFQYTGQAWLPDIGMYYYKARIYSAKLGRFLQTDPIGYDDQQNLYAYVANDPLNASDPTGTNCTGSITGGAGECKTIGPTSCSGNCNTSKASEESGNNNKSSNITSIANNFLAGAADEATFGLSGIALDYLNVEVDKNSTSYKLGEVAGFVGVSLTGAGAGIKLGAAGVRATGLGLNLGRATKAGYEFSHWIPKRLGGARSLWNGNFVRPTFHARSDPYRFRFMSPAWKALNIAPHPLQQQIMRVPTSIWGVVGGATAATSSLTTRH